MDSAKSAVVVVLLFLIATPVLNGSDIEVNFQPSESIGLKLEPRHSPAVATDKRSAVLLSEDCVEIGVISVLGENKTESDLTNRLLKEAARNGGDFVVFTTNHVTRVETRYKNGRSCIKTQNMAVSVPVYKTRCDYSVKPPACYTYTESSNTEYRPICVAWEQIPYTRTVVESSGSVWRLDRDLRQRIAERKEKELIAEREAQELRVRPRSHNEDRGDLKRVEVSGKWGFEDENGRIVINPQFDLAWPFINGLAMIQIDKKYGYVDTAGTFVVKPQFDEISFFKDGVAQVRIDNKWGYIDRTGALIAKPEFDFVASDFSEGLAVVRSGEQYGYIDRNGQQVIKPQFYSAHDFSDGLAAAADKTERWGYIDKTGGWVIPQTFCQAREFSEGLAAVAMEMPKKIRGLGTMQVWLWGYLNKDGLFVIKPQFDSAFEFSEGLAVVLVNHKYGYINQVGEFVIKPQFEDANAFHRGEATVKHDAKSSQIDKSGRVVER